MNLRELRQSMVRKRPKHNTMACNNDISPNWTKAIKNFLTGRNAIR